MLPTRYASFLKRLVAFVIDGIIAKTLAAVIVIPLGLLNAGTGVLAGLSLHNKFDRFNGYGDPGDLFKALAASFSIAAIVFWAVVGAMIFWFYFAVFESSPRQATPGKMMLGLFVTDIHGRRLTFSRALGRTLSKIPSKMFCFLGYILALFTARNQALHDMIAGTLVLEPAYPAPMVTPPMATPPGSPVSPDQTGVEIPAQPEPETKSSEQKPEEQNSGENKPEQENK